MFKQIKIIFLIIINSMCVQLSHSSATAAIKSAHKETMNVPNTDTAIKPTILAQGSIAQLRAKTKKEFSSITERSMAIKPQEPKKIKFINPLLSIQEDHPHKKFIAVKPQMRRKIQPMNQLLRHSMPTIKEDRTEKQSIAHLAVLSEEDCTLKTIACEPEEVEESDEVIRASQRLFDLALKKAQIWLDEASQKDSFDISYSTKAFALYNDCKQIIEQMEHYRNIGFEQRKKELARFQSQFFTYIIKFFDFILQNKITHYSKQVSSDIKAISFKKSLFSKNSNWNSLKKYIKLLINFIGKKQPFIEELAQFPDHAKDIQKLELKIETSLIQIKELLLEIEKKIFEDCFHSKQEVIDLAQIANNIFSQFELFIALDIPLFNSNAQQLITQIKEIKERINAEIDKELILFDTALNIINGGQKFDADLPYDAKLALSLKMHRLFRHDQNSASLLKLHQVLNNNALSKVALNANAHARKPVDNMAIVLTHNAALLLVHYLDLLCKSTLEFDKSHWAFLKRWAFTNNIDQEFFHLLDFLSHNKAKVMFTKNEHEFILDRYTQLKYKILDCIHAIQNKIQQQKNAGSLTSQSHHEFIAQMQGFFAVLEKLNKKFFILGIDQSLMNLAPCFAALEKRPAQLVAQLTQEKSEAEKQITELMELINSDIQIDHFDRIFNVWRNFESNSKMLAQMTKSPENDAFLETSLTSVGKSFHFKVQHDLNEIQGFISQAILNARALNRDNVNDAWQKSESLLNSFLAFMKRFVSNQHTYFFTNEHLTTESEQTLKIFNSIRNTLFHFIVSLEQEIKQDLRNQTIDASIIKNKIHQFHFAIWHYENIHDAFHHAGQAQTIRLKHRIDALNDAVEKYKQKAASDA